MSELRWVLVTAQFPVQQELDHLTTDGICSLQRLEALDVSATHACTWSTFDVLSVGVMRVVFHSLAFTARVGEVIRLTTSILQ